MKTNPIKNALQRKNYTMLAILVGLIAMIYGISIVKMALHPNAYDLNRPR